MYDIEANTNNNNDQGRAEIAFTILKELSHFIFLSLSNYFFFKKNLSVKTVE